jgi:VIT1/CCC1 family predicted Fe2+/Mn2+ transporter
VLIAAVILVCIVLAILGFLVPRLSDHARRGADKGFSKGAMAGSMAPGPIGRLLGKSFGTAQRAADKSNFAGKRARFKSPF